MDGVADLGVVDSAQIRRRDPKVRGSELALYDEQRQAPQGPESQAIRDFAGARITAMISSTAGGYCIPLLRGGRPWWYPRNLAGERRRPRNRTNGANSMMSCFGRWL